MSLREYFCSNGIFHLEELKPFHSQQRLLRILEIEQEASFWLKREHLGVPDGIGRCLLRRCQHWTEGLKTFNESGSWHSDNCGGPCVLSGCSEDSSISPAKWKLCGLKPHVFSYQKHFPKHGNEATRRRKLDGLPAAEHAQRFLEGFGKRVSRGSSAHVGCSAGEPFLLLFFFFSDRCLCMEM